MNRDGRLAGAIAAWRAGRAVGRPPDVAGEAVRLLEGSGEAREAWHRLTEQANSRWKVEVDPDLVLGLVAHSALVAAMRDEVRGLRAATERRYSLLRGAAGLLFEYFLERSGLTREAFLRTDFSNPPNDEVAGARHCEWILGTLEVEEIVDGMHVGDLPEDNSRRGPGAEARMFEHCLSIFLTRAYGRPFDSFVLRISAVLYPGAASTDEALLARSRQREYEGARRRRDDADGRSDEGDYPDDEPDFTHPSRYRGSDLFVSREVRAASAVAANLRLLRDATPAIRPQRIPGRRR